MDFLGGGGLEHNSALDKSLKLFLQYELECFYSDHWSCCFYKPTHLSLSLLPPLPPSVHLFLNCAG